MSGKPNYLTHASQLQCQHGGILTVPPPTKRSLVVNGQPVLTATDVLSGTIVGCTQVGVGQVPCTKVVTVTRGKARAIDVDGLTPVLSTLKGMTNGSPIQDFGVAAVGNSNASVSRETSAQKGDEPLSENWTISNLRWSHSEARTGDTVSLLARTTDLADGTPVQLTIYEYDADGRHDLVRTLFSSVASNRIQVDWQYKYHRDTDDILTQEELERYGSNYNHPEYFFVIEAFGITFGQNQESRMLRYKDWLELTLLDQATGDAIPNEQYMITFADGSKREGKLDAQGFLRIENAPPGRFRVSFPKLYEE